jgi:hypothetical protein
MTRDRFLNSLIWLWLFLAALLALTFPFKAKARDDGRYAQSPFKPRFDSLGRGKGPCRSDADGTALSDLDWETKGSHDEAVITEPNRLGKTMVWPMYNRALGTLSVEIRCFMPGSMIYGGIDAG